MKERMIATAILGTMLCMLIGTGIASAFSIALTDTNVSGLPDVTFATVKGYVDGGDSSIFHFEVDLPSTLKSELNGDDNFGLDKFYFNSDLTLTSDMFDNFDPDTWEVFKTGGSNFSAFGRFSVQLKDTSTPAPTKLYFDILYTTDVTEDNFLLPSSGDANLGNGYFGAHIKGFSYDGIGSVQVSNTGRAPIPEPSTLLLLGNGLLGFVFYSRRMRKK